MLCAHNAVQGGVLYLRLSPTSSRGICILWRPVRRLPLPLSPLTLSLASLLTNILLRSFFDSTHLLPVSLFLFLHYHLACLPIMSDGTLLQEVLYTNRAYFAAETIDTFAFG
jgi:hypothetical protein